MRVLLPTRKYMIVRFLCTVITLKTYTYKKIHDDQIFVYMDYSKKHTHFTHTC
jgi:hypothetical protein